MPTAEKSKRKIYTIMMLDKYLKDKVVRTDHPDQRLAEQWNSEDRDNLISDGLQDNPVMPIVICEQVINNVPVQWIVDGKQKSTNFVKYRRNLFKLGKKIDRPIVNYVHVVTDGEESRAEICECDIRGKFYRDLPEELRDRFDLYEVQAEYYMDCADDDVDYHIRRYNRCKPMTAAQKGMLYLGTDNSREVKKLAQNSFFKDCIGKYSDADMRNGNIDRIITESLMAINFLPHWKKGQNAICAYLRGHICDDAFSGFESELDRLSGIVNDQTRELFNARDSFLFFALFHEFCKMGLEDSDFALFLKAFPKMRDYDVEGTTYNSLMEKGTKDTTVIKAKLDVMKALMENFLGEKVPETTEITDRKVRAFVNEFEESDLFQSAEEARRTAFVMLPNWDVTEEQIADTGLYLGILHDWGLGIDNEGFMSADNIPELLRFVEYAVKNDCDDDFGACFKDYAQNYTGGIVNAETMIKAFQ